MDHCYRIEQKYPLTLEELHAFRIWQKRHGSLFRQAYPDRQVNSIYLDTPGLAHYQANQEGFPKRHKVRLRWYGQTNTPDILRVEIKRRYNSFNYKDVEELRWNKQQLEPLREISGRVRKKLKPTMRSKMTELLVPTVFMQYFREYYATTSAVRLTLDTQLCFAHLLHGQQMCRRLVNSRIAAVVEVKYFKEQAQGVSGFLNGYLFQRTRNSKYTNAFEGI